MARPTDKQLAERRCTAKEFLDTRDSHAEWRKRLDSGDEKIALQTWIYLNDRVYGKPAQAVDMTTKGEAITQLIVNL
jgi:hypothetical protein